MVLHTDNLRLEIRSDGVVKSLAAKPSGAQYAWTAEPGPVATVYRGGKAVYTSGGRYPYTIGPRVLTNELIGDNLQ